MEHRKSKALTREELENQKRLVEAMIFAAPEPISGREINRFAPQISEEIVPSLVEMVNEEYTNQNHPFQIVHGANGYRYATNPTYGQYVKKLVVGSGRVKLSRAALETISIIAYKQPISRTEIEDIRGVDSSGVLRMLLERGLVTVKKNTEKRGRALHYETTDKFLNHFGLKKIEELPSPESLIEDMERIENEDSELSEIPEDQEPDSDS